MDNPKKQSKKKPRKQSSEAQNQPAIPTPEIPTPEVQISPEERKLMESSMTEMMNVCAQLIFEVAACECDERDECEVFKLARQIAKAMSKLTKTTRGFRPIP